MGIRNTWVFSLYFIGCCHASRMCFQHHDELSRAVGQYLLDNSSDTAIANIYGHPIGNWCVSNVTDFSKLFLNATEFDEDISDWDTRQATNMHGMFEMAASFNQPLDKWDTSNVEIMKSMFYGARSFNQPLDSWDLSTVKNMKNMFHHADSFNQTLCSWGDRIRFVVSSLETSTQEEDGIGSGLFGGTSCPTTADPDFSSPIVGPLCYPCGQQQQQQPQYGQADAYASFLTFMCLKMAGLFLFCVAILALLTKNPWRHEEGGIDPSDSKLTEFELLHLAEKG